MKVTLLIFFLVSNTLIAQKSSLYVIVSDSTNVKIKHMIDKKYVFSIIKKIPKENFSYEVFIDNNNRVQKRIPLSTHYNSSNQKNVFAELLTTKIKKNKILKKNYGVINSDIIKHIKYESLVTVIENVNDVFFLITDDKNPEYYKIFKRLD